LLTRAALFLSRLRTMMSYRKLVFLTVASIILLLSSYLFPKSKKEKNEPASKSESVFRVPVDIVVLNVTATDKAGNPVTDLTANDFKIYDKGKPQSIQTFTLESSGPTETEEVKTTTASPKSTMNTGSTDRARKGLSSPKRTSTVQNTSGRPRLISMFIDDLTMYAGSDFSRMFDDMKKFVQNDIGPTDQICIISGSGQVQFPFSNNKQQILDGLTLASKKLNYLPFLRYMTDLQAWQLSNEDWQTDSSAWKEMYGNLIEMPNDAIERFRVRTSLGSSEAAKKYAYSFLSAKAIAQNAIIKFQTYKLLQVLRQHIRALRHFEGAKMIVFFSDGFLPYPLAVYLLQEVIDTALRSGIILDCSNIVGVPTFMDIAKATSAKNIVKDDQDAMDDIRAQEGPLALMARDTGGMFFTYSNDMHKQLQKIVQRQSYYYIISYGMPSQKADGSYHNIRLEVARPELELSYRKGYFTIREELTFENSRKEDIIEALQGPGNMNQIPMALSYNYYQESDATYSVSFLTDVNMHNIKFVEEEARRRNQISLVLAAFDETDHYINGLEKTIDFRLQESSYTNLRSHGLNSRVELKLPMGRYKIKAVVRESTQGKMGSVTKAVEIP
jgi:VWFA-related protein